jgi:8-oxo-dGTP pyrophosphatase MutT (NUDIX family)
MGRLYRPCVGIMLFNRESNVLVAQRLDTPGNAWQMPQGGIDRGETPLRAARREMREEIGTDRATLLAESARWLRYDLPDDLARTLWGGRFCGQEQKWFAFVHATLYRILGSNRDIEDLVQDTVLEVFRSLERYRGEARLVSWISRITTRVAFAYISRRKPVSAQLESVPDPASNDPSADSQVAAREAARRLYGVLDGRLKDVPYLAGEYSIADMATYPWVARHEWHKVDLADFANVKRWYDAIGARPAAAKGMAVPPPPPG